MKIRVFLFTFLIASSFSAYANHSMKLGEVHADDPAGYVSVLTLDLSDNNEILGLSSSDNQGESAHFTLAELSKGIVVFRYKGSDAIALDKVRFDPVKGGSVQLTFMRKFKLIKKDYRTIHFVLEPNTATNELNPFVLFVDEPSDKKEKSIVDGVNIFVERTVGIVTGVQELQLFHGTKMVRDYDPAKLPQVPNLVGN